MRNIDINVPEGARDKQIETTIRRAIARAGLTVTMLGSLKSFPGCTHWHVKNGRESGTLEITFWPQSHRAWFSIQNGRTAVWIDEKMQQVGQIIQEQLQR